MLRVINFIVKSWWKCHKSSFFSLNVADSLTGTFHECSNMLPVISSTTTTKILWKYIFSLQSKHTNGFELVKKPPQSFLGFWNLEHLFKIFPLENSFTRIHFVGSNFKSFEMKCVPRHFQTNIHILELNPLPFQKMKHFQQIQSFFFYRKTWSAWSLERKLFLRVETDWKYIITIEINYSLEPRTIRNPSYIPKSFLSGLLTNKYKKSNVSSVFRSKQIRALIPLSIP